MPSPSGTTKLCSTAFQSAFFCGPRPEPDDWKAICGRTPPKLILAFVIPFADDLETKLLAFGSGKSIREMVNGYAAKKRDLARLKMMKCDFRKAVNANCNNGRSGTD